MHSRPKKMRCLALAVSMFLGLAMPGWATEPSFTGKVIGVMDGDTIAVLRADKQTVRVRLFGVDAPEGGQPFGRASKRAASQMCFGKVVKVKSTGVDRYGRMLAWVQLPEGKSLNVRMVEVGLAWHYRHYSEDAELAAAELQARRAKVGLWADANAEAPWDYRRRKRQQ